MLKSSKNQIKKSLFIEYILPRINKTDNKDILKSKIELCFSLRDNIDRAINLLCLEYYNGNHPKHHLWVDHYKFIIDNIHKNDIVLDIGTGTSNSYIAEMAKKCQIIDCCDNDESKVNANITKNKIDNINFFVMDITKELPAKRYDVVVLSHVLEHLEDPLSLLEKLKRITNKLIIRLPRYDDHWMYLVKKDLNLFYFKDRDHKREYTINDAVVLVNNAGWEITTALNDIDIKIVCHLPSFQQKELLNDKISHTVSLY